VVLAGRKDAKTTIGKIKRRPRTINGNCPHDVKAPQRLW